MSYTAIQLQPAFILRHRTYGESSLILDVLTRDLGLVSIIAKGVRKRKSKTAGLLQAFTALKISYAGKSELKTLTHVELLESAVQLKGLSLYCGFYINELVQRFLHKHDPHPEVYAEYHNCLVLLAGTEETEQILRFFELKLIDCIGYGFQLSLDSAIDETVLPEKLYSWEAESGMIENPAGYISGKSLMALEARAMLDQQALYEAKQLMRRVIDFQLQGRALKSRAVLAKIIKFYE